MKRFFSRSWHSLQNASARLSCFLSLSNPPAVVIPPSRDVHRCSVSSSHHLSSRPPHSLHRRFDSCVASPRYHSENHDDVWRDDEKSTSNETSVPHAARRLALSAIISLSLLGLVLKKRKEKGIHINKEEDDDLLLSRSSFWDCEWLWSLLFPTSKEEILKKTKEERDALQKDISELRTNKRKIGLKLRGTRRKLNELRRDRRVEKKNLESEFETFMTKVKESEDRLLKEEQRQVELRRQVFFSENRAKDAKVAVETSRGALPTVDETPRRGRGGNEEKKEHEAKSDSSHLEESKQVHSRAVKHHEEATVAFVDDTRLLGESERKVERLREDCELCQLQLKTHKTRIERAEDFFYRESRKLVEEEKEFQLEIVTIERNIQFKVASIKDLQVRVQKKLFRDRVSKVAGALAIALSAFFVILFLKLWASGSLPQFYTMIRPQWCS